MKCFSFSMMAFVALITCQNIMIIILKYFVEYINDLHISVKVWEKVMFLSLERSVSITATILEITEEILVFFKSFHNDTEVQTIDYLFILYFNLVLMF